MKIDNIGVTAERLHFRPIAPGDEAYIFPEVDEELTRYWIGWEPSATIEEERQKVLEKVRLSEIPPNFEWMAFDAEGHFIGCCGISPSEEPGEFEVNLWVAHKEQRKGYAREMLQAALAWTSQHTDLAYLVYSYTEGNAASQAIIAKMGVPLYREVSYMKRGVLKKVYDHKIVLREKG